MYKSNKFRKKLSLDQVPKRVMLSQRPVEPIPVEKEITKDLEVDNEVLSSQQEEEIPSSQNENQEPNSTQSQIRFLSQRSQIQRPPHDESMRGKNYFEIALISCKIKVTDLGCEFLIEGDDPISFIRRFRSFLGSSSDNAKRFIDGFTKAFSLKLESIKVAQKFLSGCIMREGDKVHISQTSLIQCLFAVSSLKDAIANALLNNVKTYVTEQGEQADAFIVGLVVAQFKFSDQFLDADSYNKAYEQFFEILEEIKNDACRSVIISNFRDLDEFKQDDAVKRLLTMYENEHELLTPFIETFTEMSINEDTKARISSLVNHLLETNCESKLYPGIVKYLLCYVVSPNDIVNSIRKYMKWNSANADLKMKVIQKLEKSVRREKSKIAEAWIKAISNLDDQKDLKVLDFVMMLVITSIKEEKFPAIKKIFVNKIPEGFFTLNYLRDVFKTFPDIIALYSGTLLELLNALQKNRNYEINVFSSTCFKELFGVKSSDKKEIIGSLVQSLCEKTAQTPFSAKTNFKAMTLRILGEIKKTPASADALLIHHKILLRVLDNSKVKLTFYEHRLVMELLCSLAYATDFKSNRNRFEIAKLEEDRASLQEHLEMMTNKLMCNPDVKIKQLGIIGAIKIVGSLVVNVLFDSDQVMNKVSIDDIPEGPIKDAATRVEFIIKSVRGDPLGLAMIYDEMNLEFQGKRDNYAINEMFLVWLSEIIHDKLDHLIGFEICKDIPESDGIRFSHQMVVETEDFSQPTHAIKLGLLVMKEHQEEVVTIPALFKLTRTLMQHRTANLAEIYVFAVMPITLPEGFASPEDELDVTDEALTKQKLDIYFHCINWLREIIGTYCHWTDKDQEALTECVIKRLKQLVRVENRLSQLLPEVPQSYYPPPAAFLDTEDKKKAFDTLRKEKKAIQKPPKKTRKKNDSSIVNSTVQTSPELFETKNKIRPFCREIDTQVVLLLTKTFKFSTSDLFEAELGLNELMFLLDDVYHKVKANISSDNLGFYNPITVIDQLKDAVIVYLVEIFKNICEELVVLSQKADQEDCNDVFFTKDANILKNCFCLILQLFEVILSCPQLKLPANKNLLQETLTALIPKNLLVDDEHSQDDLCKSIIRYCEGFERNVKNCESAVALMKFLTCISKFSSNDEDRAFVHQLCERFLKKEWKNAAGDVEQGAGFNANLEKLLQMFVSETNLETLEQYVNTMSQDFIPIASKRMNHQNTFPSFCKGNSSVMVRTYLSRLSQIIATSDHIKMNYEFWRKCSNIFNKFIEIVKCIGSQNVQCTYLKNLLVFMRLFNTQGISVLKTVVSNEKKFVELVKSVQTVTRFSHGVSCDLKHHKNKSIVAIIPKLREAFAKNFQAVSPLVTLATGSIATGCLRNYDINHKEIWSQNTTESANVGESDDEEDVMQISDDETVGNLDESREGPAVSFKSRSTIV